jgi:hypothetical protein
MWMAEGHLVPPAWFGTDLHDVEVDRDANAQRN